MWPRSITAQVFGLALICVATTLIIGLFVTVVMPPPPQAAMRVRDVAEVLKSGESSYDLILEARQPSIQDRRAQQTQPASIIAEGLAHALGLSVEDVVVVMITETSPGSNNSLTILNLPPGTLQAGAHPPSLAELVATRDITFPPFRAAIRRGAGWISVRPASAQLSVWHIKLGFAFLAAAAVLTLPTLWLTRLFTRPLRDLAAAAEAIDSGPGAPPLPIGGPTEIRSAATALQAMQGRLNAHVEQRTRMLFAIAHDLRTPLTSLKLRLEAAEPALKQRMAPEILRMQAMIDRLLEFAAQPAADRVELVDLAALVRQAADRQPVGKIATKALPAVLKAPGDPLELSRLLDNIMSNAVKFGGPEQVRVSLIRSSRYVRLVIQDAGPGIPQDQLGSVFEPFVRLEHSRNAETGGIGLGLALAKAVVDRHGGRISLANVKPHGLAVTVDLPLERRCTLG